ncbi:MAG: glycosyltransferase family 2 protein [bacterium]
MKISIVIPLFNEEKNLTELVWQINNVVKKNSCNVEIIFIDDGSTDNSCEVLAKIADSSENNIKIIQFRKNFGKSAALSAGFSEAGGDIIITMDADLQDDPAEIPNLIEKLNSGYDLVSGWKQNRKDPLSKTIPSKIFNKAVRFFTKIKIHDFNCGLKAYKKEVIKNIEVYGELHRFLPVLANYQGFKIAEIKVNHRPRIHGKTKFGARRFTNGFIDLLTVMILTKYIRKPGHFFGSWGLASLFLGTAFCGYLSILWFMGQRPIGNRPLLFLGILLIIIAVQLISMGLLGELINQSNKKQNYNIKQVYSKEKDKIK